MSQQEPAKESVPVNESTDLCIQRTVNEHVIKMIKSFSGDCDLVEDEEFSDSDEEEYNEEIDNLYDSIVMLKDDASQDEYDQIIEGQMK